MMSNKTKLTQKQRVANKKKYLETIKIRYNLYREAGYTAEEARKLRFKTLDVSNIKVDKKTGKIQKKTNYKRAKEDLKVDRYAIDAKAIENDTTWSNWGMLTQDKRYRDDTARIAKYLQKRYNLSNDQSYYFLYTMFQSNMTFKQTKLQLLTNKEFETYDQAKKERQQKGKSQRVKTTKGKRIEKGMKYSNEEIDKLRKKKRK